MSRPEPREFVAIIDGVPVCVTYTERWLDFPELRMATDHFAFRSVEEPAKPHPLSMTGYLSHFAEPVTVEYFGGAEGYVAAFAEAKLRGKEVVMPDDDADTGMEELPQVPESPRQLSLF